MKINHPKLIICLILGLALSGARALATGGGGQTNSPCVPTVTVYSLSSNSFSFNIGGGITGPRYVWSTSDLTTPIWNWDLRATITLNGSPQVYTDNTISNVAYRFYKVVTTNGDCCSSAIGFIRLDVLPGTFASPGANAYIANQLYPANTLDSLFNPMPDGRHLPAGTTIMKWDTSGFFFVEYVWDGSSWGSDGGVSLNPGEGACLLNPLTNALRISFAGLVQDGTASVSLPEESYNLVSSTVPKSGGLQSALGYIPHESDAICTWTGGPGNTVYNYTSGGWSPSQPNIRIGESFFQFNATNAHNWQMSFSGCPYLPPF